MKKKICVIVAASVLSIAMLCSGCSESDPDSGKTSPTANITAKPTATATKTSPPTSEGDPTASSATAQPEPEGKNLLYFALEEDPIESPTENLWGPVAPDKWTGPCWERKIEEVEIDGEYVNCLYVTHTITDETGANIGNVFGVGDIIEPNKKYKFTVTLKYTDSTEASDPSHRDWMYITCNAAKQNVTADNNQGSGLKFQASDEWQKLEYVFTTGNKLPTYIENNNHAQDPYIMVGPSCDYQRFYGEVSNGIELWISEVSLVELAE